jgi:hypothetical protein
LFEGLIWATAASCGLALLIAWLLYRDAFHPVILVSPLFAFMYVLMPAELLRSGQLYLYVSEDRCIVYQAAALSAFVAFTFGCLAGSVIKPEHAAPKVLAAWRAETVRKGGYFLGCLGLAAWLFAIQGAGGFANVFSRAKGMGWSEFGLIRDSAYLLIVGLLLLLSPEGFAPRSRPWQLAVGAFAAPYLIQGLLGAQRGPTFLVVMTVVISWYLARQKRPSLALLLAGGAGLTFLMLFLVVNRGNIYLGSEAELKTDVTEVFSANESNEYIFGAGCFTTANQTDSFFWGKRYLAQVLVRPIPRQLWPTKYEDVGLPELRRNAGVSGEGLELIMGWSQIPGAAAGIVADLWVEFSWLSIPVLAAIGFGFGRLWSRVALHHGGPWNTVFTVSSLLSVYFVSQSGEAVIFRFLILVLPAFYVWHKARREAAITPASETAEMLWQPSRVHTNP